ncbi:hypothetical protein EDE12_111137 [Methylosinus sp. sav-2]|uniref:DUF6270 domain-containing protein n=1 Tax=Methylosinus sp. sav-2 TaxID=2485168 RepID=UPI000B33AC7C|nr:DUF6270 domain-containing protein [Methylosinus sp. sav-2]TDX62230.1 hypothetical protein EDE12_111137 [Methylosinus sp. sav-2]
MAKKHNSGKNISVVARESSEFPAEKAYVEDRRKSFITLGGCSTYESGLRLNEGLFRSRGHLWRRPTIALVADPIEKIDSRFSCLPPEFLTYLVNDAKKLHLPNLLEMDAELLIFDLTRDLRSGVVALSETQFVIDPLEGVHILEGLTPETMNQDVFDKVFKGGERISFHANWARFFPLWKRAFARSIEILSRKFSRLVLLEHYFTCKVNGVPYTYDFAPGAAEMANVALEKMYDFARSFDNISFISLPRKLFITGREAPWGGPSDTHYLPEVYLLYAEKTAQLLFPEREDGSRAIIDQLFLRAAERDDLIVQIQALTEERDRLATDNAAFAAARDAALEERDEMRARLEGAADDTLTPRDDHAPATAENDADFVECESATIETRVIRAERDAALAEKAAAVAERALALYEREAMRRERDAAVADRDRILGENAAMAAEWSKEAHEKEAMRAERDAAIANAEAFAADRDRIMGENAAMAAEWSKEAHEKEAMRAERDQAVADAHAFAADRDRVLAESTALLVERDRASSEIDEIIAQLEAALAHSEELAAERDRLAAEKAALISERDDARGASLVDAQ